MYAVFKAAEDPVVIDTRHGENTKSSRIEYKSETGSKLYLWERLDQAPWQFIHLAELKRRVGLEEPTQTADWQKYGAFRTPALKSGQSYCLRAYLDQRIDPNQPGSDKGDEFCLLALKKDPDTRVLVDTYEVDSGGTWVSVTAAGAVPVAWIVEVGEGDPATTPTGLRSFSTPLAREVDARFRKLAHFELVDNLLAGNSYTVLGRAVNALGDWEERINRFTLLKRMVDVNLTNIHVINDSDPMGRGTALFTIKVIEGNPAAYMSSVIDQWEFGGDDFEITDGQNIPLPPGGGVPYTATIGPRRVTSDNVAVGIELYGVEFDEFGLTEPSHIANEWHDGTWSFDFPRGSSQEQVTNAPLTKHAVPMFSSDDFFFDLEGTYSVTYM
jgi:hypothetical protein